MAENFKWSVDHDSVSKSVFLRVESEGEDAATLSLMFSVSSAGQLIHALIQSMKKAAGVADADI